MVERLPRHVERLEDAPEWARKGYVENPAGGHDLHPDVAAHEDMLAARYASIERDAERRHRQLRQVIVHRELRDGLTEGGISPRLRKAALALLMETYDIEVTGELSDTPVATAITPYGPMPARTLALQWAASDEAKAFRDQSPISEPGGPFSAALAALKNATRH